MIKVLFNEPVHLILDGLECDAMFAICSRFERVPNKPAVLVQGNMVPLNMVKSIELDKDFN